MSQGHWSRRQFLGTAGLGVAGLVVAACGGQPVQPTAAPEKPSQSTSPGAAPTPATAATSQAAAPAQKPASSGEAVKITFFTWGSSERFKVWKDQVVGGFNTSHPNIVASLLEGPSDYQSKLLTMAAGGAMPDVFRLSEYWAVDVFAKNFCLELGPSLQRDNFKIEDYTSPPYTQCQYKGKWYAVPHGAAGNFVVWYNRDLFKAGGVGFPKDDWTWDDFANAAKTLTKDTNGDGKPEQWGTSMSIANYAVPYEAIWSNGGEELTEDGKHYEIDQSPAMDALETLIKLETELKVAPAPAQIPQGLGDIFLSGKVAMHYSGAWYEATAHQAKFDFGMVLNPKMKSGQVAFAEQNATAAYRQGKNLDAAWEFLKYLISEQNQHVESSAGLNGPSMPKILKSSEFLEVKGPPYSRKSVVPNLLCKTRGATLIPHYTEIQSAFVQKMGPVWTGERKLQDVVPQIVDAAKKAIAENE